MVNEWKTIELGQLIDYANGSSFPNKHQGNRYEEIDFYKVSDMNNPNNKVYMNQAENTVSTEMVQTLKGKLHPENTVIFPKVGAALLTNKRRILSKKSIFDNNIMGIIAKEALYDKFLYYYLQTIDFAKYVQKGAVPSINKSIVNTLTLKLPSILEQQKIAAILSSVDEAIEKTEQIIEQTEKVKKGLMQQLFSNGIGHKRFKDTSIGKIPEEWQLVKLGETNEIKTGGTPSKSNNYYWENGTVKWMASGDIHMKRVKDVSGRITEEGLNNSNARLLPRGTVMIALNGQGKTRGAVAFLEAELTCNQSLAGFLPSDKIVPEFLFYNLESRYNEIRNYTGDGSRTGLNLKILREIKMPLSNIQEQRKIANVFKSVDENFDYNYKRLYKLKNLKQGLMQQLLTGKVRVPINDEEVV